MRPPAARIACVLVATVIVATGLFGGTHAAAAVRSCGRDDTTSVAHGRYLVQQNEWNATGLQCMRVDGTSFTITRARFGVRTDGPPGSYPSIYTGCHWGRCTARGPLPIGVGAIGRAHARWRTTLPRTGTYDVAFDLWTNQARTASGQPNGSEIMIWLDHRGPVQPAGSQVATVRIHGVSWRVWTAVMAGWNYVAYERRRPTQAVRHLDLAAFIRDSVRRGTTRRSWYLIGVEAGFEIWQHGRGLGTDRFALSVERRRQSSLGDQTGSRGPRSADPALSRVASRTFAAAVRW